jgi:large subunit ribosomal protein L30
MLKITLTKGLVGKTEVQKKVVAALGLRKFGSSVEHADTPTIRGMIRKVEHLVTVSKAEGGEKKAKPAEKRTTTKKAATAAGAAK